MWVNNFHGVIVSLTVGWSVTRLGCQNYGVIYNVRGGDKLDGIGQVLSKLKGSTAPRTMSRDITEPDTTPDLHFLKLISHPAQMVAKWQRSFQTKIELNQMAIY